MARLPLSLFIVTVAGLGALCPSGLCEERPHRALEEFEEEVCLAGLVVLARVVDVVDEQVYAGYHR